MTHKQLPFSPMKGDLLPWHGTSRCITKPHSFIMPLASFSYTGKHLLIFVTSAIALKVLTCHLGKQISIFFKLFAWKLPYFRTWLCNNTPLHSATAYCISRAVCQPAPIAKNWTDPHGRLFCKGNNANCYQQEWCYRPLQGDINEDGGVTSALHLLSLSDLWPLWYGNESCFIKMFRVGLCPIRSHYVRQLHIHRPDKKRGNIIGTAVVWAQCVCACTRMDQSENNTKK